MGRITDAGQCGPQSVLYCSFWAKGEGVAVFILSLLLCMIPMHRKTVDNIPVTREFKVTCSHSESIPENLLLYQMAFNIN